jgi:glucose-6-phosphate 1-dehydrogenase
VSQTESKRVTHIPSDALVFFGATGDLAHKKIFPALQKLAKRGKLEVPVIGVASGQFNGYRDEVGVNRDSQVETYVAMRLYINSWRWKGVPFYIRAGKSLPVTATEVRVSLRQPPAIFTDDVLPPNYIRLRVTPDLVIAIGALVREADDSLPVAETELLVSQVSDPEEVQAYEELLSDAMGGNSARFARQDYVEEAWRIVDPVLDNKTPVHPYAPGSWGPVEADQLADADGGWIEPK